MTGRPTPSVHQLCCSIAGGVLCPVCAPIPLHASPPSRQLDEPFSLGYTWWQPCFGWAVLTLQVPGPQMPEGTEKVSQVWRGCSQVTQGHMGTTQAFSEMSRKVPRMWQSKWGVGWSYLTSFFFFSLNIVYSNTSSRKMLSNTYFRQLHFGAGNCSLVYTCSSRRSKPKKWDWVWRERQASALSGSEACMMLGCGWDQNEAAAIGGFWRESPEPCRLQPRVWSYLTWIIKSKLTQKSRAGGYHFPWPLNLASADGGTAGRTNHI